MQSAELYSIKTKHKYNTHRERWVFFLTTYLGWDDRGVTELEKFTFENYDITVYYESDVIHRVEEQRNIHTMFFENDAVIMSENDGLFLFKRRKKVNLCETGNKSFTIDK